MSSVTVYNPGTKSGLFEDGDLLTLSCFIINMI